MQRYDEYGEYNPSSGDDSDIDPNESDSEGENEIRRYDGMSQLKHKSHTLPKELLFKKEEQKNPEEEKEKTKEEKEEEKPEEEVQEQIDEPEGTEITEEDIERVSEEIEKAESGEVATTELTDQQAIDRVPYQQWLRESDKHLKRTHQRFQQREPKLKNLKISEIDDITDILDEYPHLNKRLVADIEKIDAKTHEILGEYKDRESYSYKTMYKRLHEERAEYIEQFKYRLRYYLAKHGMPQKAYDKLMKFKDRHIEKPKGLLDRLKERTKYKHIQPDLHEELEELEIIKGEEAFIDETGDEETIFTAPVKKTTVEAPEQTAIPTTKPKTEIRQRKPKRKGGYTQLNNEEEIELETTQPKRVKPSKPKEVGIPPNAKEFAKMGMLGFGHQLNQIISDWVWDGVYWDHEKHIKSLNKRGTAWAQGRPYQLKHEYNIVTHQGQEVWFNEERAKKWVGMNYKERMEWLDIRGYETGHPDRLKWNKAKQEWLDLVQKEYEEKYKSQKQQRLTEQKTVIDEAIAKQKGGVKTGTVSQQEIDPAEHARIQEALKKPTT
uniref:Uncharacterized protein n=1 Tax=Parvoviridae sp. TaxID=1940570 RepID=A0A7D3UGR1_9VIRU|nr:MAG: hypothetical protein [Parvoviridae sp.]